MTATIRCFCLLLLLAARPQGADQVVQIALASLGADSLALGHLGVKSLVGFRIVQRSYDYRSWQEELQWFSERISGSTRCPWRGMPRRAINYQISRAAEEDSGHYPPAMRSSGYGITVGRDGRQTLQLPLDSVIAFVSPSYRGMRLVTFFRAWSDREGMDGGRIGVYASFNSGVEYLTCADSSGLELLGPARIAYD